MAMIAYQENHLKQADIIDEDHLDLEGVILFPETSVETAMLVCLLREHLECVWVMLNEEL